MRARITLARRREPLKQPFDFAKAGLLLFVN
jgi:hypothetical protein